MEFCVENWGVSDSSGRRLFSSGSCEGSPVAYRRESPNLFRPDEKTRRIRRPTEPRPETVVRESGGDGGESMSVGSNDGGGRWGSGCGRKSRRGEGSRRES